jgi:hypothetical protein
MNSLLAARQNAGPHEDTVLDAYHQLAYLQSFNGQADLLGVARN